MALRKHFPGQLENEKILAVIHRHWFNILSHFFAVIFLLLGTLLFFFLAPVLASLAGFVLNTALILFITSTLLLFTWVYGFFIWIDYYFDVWVITNERVLNIEQKGLFTRIVSEVNLWRVQDVTTRVEGFLPTLLNFGDIFIQTAGEEKRFHFRCVASPDAHKDMIVTLVKNHRERNFTSSDSGQNTL